MSKSYWRDQAAPIIERVLKEMAGKPEKEIRKALHDAYPFGPREYHPLTSNKHQLHPVYGRADGTCTRTKATR